MYHDSGADEECLIYECYEKHASQRLFCARHWLLLPLDMKGLHDDLMRQFTGNRIPNTWLGPALEYTHLASHSVGEVPRDVTLDRMDFVRRVYIYPAETIPFVKQIEKRFRALKRKSA